MAALTQDRNTPRRYLEREVVLDVKGSTTIYAGAMVAVDSTGYAVPAADTSGHTVIGRAQETVDNSGGSDGDEEIAVAKGVFKYDNAGGANDIVQADHGADCHVYDDQTVGKAAGVTNNIVAGKVDDLDSDGVWVAII